MLGLEELHPYSEGPLEESAPTQCSPHECYLFTWDLVLLGHLSSWADGIEVPSPLFSGDILFSSSDVKSGHQGYSQV